MSAPWGGLHQQLSSQASGAVHSFLEQEVSPVEQSPDGRYFRYATLLGRGACKQVYRAFDAHTGSEVAWNQVNLGGCDLEPATLEYLFKEINLLRTLHHKNIMTFYDWWHDKQQKTINFITEIFLSGSLRAYRKKACNVNIGIIKRWAWQILDGLVYLHGHEPPIVHRDLKCDNIFYQANVGVVKIGDLGLATANKGLSVVGTPEFLAPEIYEESYDQKVDIYSFGMCLLELVTKQYPYSECQRVAQIFRKVTMGIKPLALQQVTGELREVIELCIAHDPADRPEARQLVKHQFFDSIRKELAYSGHSDLRRYSEGMKPSRPLSGTSTQPYPSSQVTPGNTLGAAQAQTPPSVSSRFTETQIRSLSMPGNSAEGQVRPQVQVLSSRDEVQTQAPSRTSIGKAPGPGQTWAQSAAEQGQGQGQGQGDESSVTPAVLQRWAEQANEAQQDQTPKASQWASLPEPRSQGCSSHAIDVRDDDGSDVETETLSATCSAAVFAANGADALPPSSTCLLDTHDSMMEAEMQLQQMREEIEADDAMSDSSEEIIVPIDRLASALGNDTDVCSREHANTHGAEDAPCSPSALQRGAGLAQAVFLSNRATSRIFDENPFASMSSSSRLGSALLPPGSRPGSESTTAVLEALEAPTRTGSNLLTTGPSPALRISDLFGGRPVPEPQVQARSRRASAVQYSFTDAAASMPNPSDNVFASAASFAAGWADEGPPALTPSAEELRCMSTLMPQARPICGVIVRVKPRNKGRVLQALTPGQRRFNTPPRENIRVQSAPAVISSPTK